MLRTIVAVIAAAAVAHADAPGPDPTAASLAAAYESVATTIIGAREAEDALVEAILRAYLDVADGALAGAVARPEAERGPLLIAAATAITWIANEGDARVQAVRQRLLKAGHHHHSDGMSQEDYMFVDGAEKKALLDLAGEVGRQAPRDVDGIRALSAKLGTLFESTIAPE
jgi:hypothetical protein